MTTWEWIRWLHLLAMAFFVGGQLVLIAAVVPAFRGADERTRLRVIARRFGWGRCSRCSSCSRPERPWPITSCSGAPGSSSSNSRWSRSPGCSSLAHLRRPQQHWLEGLVFAVSLAIVWLGVALSH